jgi:hypothetical protein
MKKRRLITIKALNDELVPRHYSHVRKGLCIVHLDKGFYSVTHINSLKKLGAFGYCDTLKEAKKGLQIAESLASKYSFSWQWSEDKLCELVKKNSKLYDQLKSKSFT